MKDNRKRIYLKSFLAGALFVILLVMNLTHALNEYNLGSVSLNYFLVQQGLHQYAGTGKIIISQAYRENMTETVLTNFSSGDTSLLEVTGIKKIISIKQGVHYIYITPNEQH